MHKRHEVLICAKTCTNLENILRQKKTQRTTKCMIHSIFSSRKCPESNSTDRKRIHGWFRLGWVRELEGGGKSAWKFFLGKKIALKLIMIMDAEQCEYAKDPLNCTPNISEC